MSWMSAVSAGAASMFLGASSAAGLPWMLVMSAVAAVAYKAYACLPSLNQVLFALIVPRCKTLYLESSDPYYTLYARYIMAKFPDRVLGASSGLVGGQVTTSVLKAHFDGVLAETYKGVCYSVFVAQTHARSEFVMSCLVLRALIRWFFVSALFGRRVSSQPQSWRQEIANILALTTPFSLTSGSGDRSTTDSSKKDSRQSQDKDEDRGPPIVIFTMDRTVVSILSYVEDVTNVKTRPSLLHLYTADVQVSKTNGLQSASWIYAESQCAKRMSTLYVSSTIKKKVIDDLAMFMASRDKYYALGKPYKRGYVLYGAPGNGKTSLVRAFAAENSIPVFTLPGRAFLIPEALAKLMRDIHNHIRPGSLYIVLLEDFDRVLQYAQKSDTVFDLNEFLNVFDGVDESSDRIVFMTANSIGVVQDIDRSGAMLRYGRFHVHASFEDCDRDQVCAVLDTYFRGTPQEAQVQEWLHNNPKSEPIGQSMCNVIAMVDEAIAMDTPVSELLPKLLEDASILKKGVNRTQNKMIQNEIMVSKLEGGLKTDFDDALALYKDRKRVALQVEKRLRIMKKDFQYLQSLLSHPESWRAVRVQECLVAARLLATHKSGSAPFIRAAKKHAELHVIHDDPNALFVAEQAKLPLLYDKIEKVTESLDKIRSERNAARAVIKKIAPKYALTKSTYALFRRRKIRRVLRQPSD